MSSFLEIIHIMFGQDMVPNIIGDMYVHDFANLMFVNSKVMEYFKNNVEKHRLYIQTNISSYEGSIINKQIKIGEIISGNIKPKRLYYLFEKACLNGHITLIKYLSEYGIEVDMIYSNYDYNYLYKFKTLYLNQRKTFETLLYCTNLTNFFKVAEIIDIFYEIVKRNDIEMIKKITIGGEIFIYHDFKWTPNSFFIYLLAPPEKEMFYHLVESQFPLYDTDLFIELIDNGSLNPGKMLFNFTNMTLSIYILENGYDPDSTIDHNDPYEITPLDWAVYNNEMRYIKLFIEYGSTITTKTLYFAKMDSQQDIIDYLETCLKG